MGLKEIETKHKTFRTTELRACAGIARKRFRDVIFVATRAALFENSRNSNSNYKFC